MEMVRFVLSVLFLAAGMFFIATAAFGVNRFSNALRRMHAAAVGDTMGLLLMLIGLVIWKGFHFGSLKLLSVVVFFWLSSPVCSHMIAMLESETDPEEIPTIDLDALAEEAAARGCDSDPDTDPEKGDQV